MTELKTEIKKIGNMSSVLNSIILPKSANLLVDSLLNGLRVQQINWG
jgi:hypothetical protein